MQVTNNKPTILSPVYFDDIAKPMDPFAIVRDMVAAPLFTPKVSGYPAEIKDDDGNVMQKDDVAKLIIQACGERIDIPSEQMAKKLFSATLVYYNPKTTLNVDNLFALQAGTKEQMPEPSDTIIYTAAGDVKPTCKAFLAGTCSYETFFATLAYFARPHTLGFYFANELAFDQFKQWFAAQTAQLVSANVFSPNTNSLLSDFQTVKLDELTEALTLRADDGQNNDPYTFARLLIRMLMNYTKVVPQETFGVLPFSVSELVVPKSVVFVNVEKHHTATPKAIKEEWNMINNALSAKVTMVSNKKLQKLTAVQKQIRRIQNGALNYTNRANSHLAKVQRLRFSKTRPTTKALARYVKKVLQNMGNVNRSMNVYKSTHVTYMRANRRNPDNYNLPGKSTGTSYLPDIHVYVDTSGSISERDYEDSIKMLISMAKGMNVGLYFNSFSHILSQTTRLNLKDKSKAEIYRQFQKIDKVTGGTDYEQIWHFINRSPKRSKELSLIITDFEWEAPSAFIKHPKNLYYVPCSTFDWKIITGNAKMFAQSMLHNDPNIRKHLFL